MSAFLRHAPGLPPMGHSAAGGAAPRAGGTQTVQLHATLGLLFLGMTAALGVVTLTGTPSAWEPLAILCLVLALPLTISLGSSGRWSPPLMVADVLLVLNTLAGVPGMLFSDPGSSLPEQVGYTVALVVRNYVLFVGLPRALATRRLPLEDAVQGWLLAAVAFVTLGSLWVAAAQGVTLASHERLGGNWLHPNLVGAFAGVGLLICLTAAFVPALVRLPLAALSLYVLLLTQSRSALIATVVTLAVYALLSNSRRLLQFTLVSVGVGFLLFVILPPVLPSLASLGPVVNMLNRTEREDPTAGRTELVGTALTHLEESPLVGFGYNGAGRRIENGLVSLASETGVAGLLLYLAFTAWVLVPTVAMMRQTYDPRGRRIGILVMSLTVFLFVRSFGERASVFQLSDIISNAWMLLAGHMIAYNGAPRVKYGAPGGKS